MRGVLSVGCPSAKATANAPPPMAIDRSKVEGDECYCVNFRVEIAKAELLECATTEL